MSPPALLPRLPGGSGASVHPCPRGPLSSAARGMRPKAGPLPSVLRASRVRTGVPTGAYKALEGLAPAPSPHSSCAPMHRPASGLFPTQAGMMLPPGHWSEPTLPSSGSCPSQTPRGSPSHLLWASTLYHPRPWGRPCQHHHLPAQAGSLASC